MANLEQINKNCCDIIYRKLLNGPSADDWEACKIFNKLVDAEKDEHNCLGCQFVDIHQTIYKNFKDLVAKDLTEEFYFKTYLFWLYQNVERIYEIFELVNPKGQNKMIKMFFEQNFVENKRIKRWANFIKHPKAFQFSHHPSYFYETDYAKIPTDSIIFDSNKIEKFYQGDKNNKELYNTIAKKTNVVILIPDLETMTNNFCEEFRLFTNWICKNDMIADFLKMESTIDTYYEDLEEDLQESQQVKASL
ncbi:hypothetical protein [Portibacter marinus]|uniref:hypothetical protein n=1 Tax=Portibacter marinus TaxID=2898660 RepID=UPI001F431777|nr:hypothetical protein [Portibacter marinus]